MSEALTHSEVDPHLVAHDERRAEAIHAEVFRRVGMATHASDDVKAQGAILEVCKVDIVSFINDWVWTFDPRNVTRDLPAEVPFALRPKQAEFLEWLETRERTHTTGLVEKSRDEGASYLFLVFILHRWLFVDHYTAAVGSRKQELVDKLDDPKTLFWKFRQMLYSLPGFFLTGCAGGFSRKEHDNFLRIVNPHTGASFTGEAGDNMGRGGRTTMYGVDEWAHIDRPEIVNRSLSQNSDSIIKIFTPNGVGDIAYQERFSGKYPVFTFSWRDNPDKNFTAERTTADGRTETYFPWYAKQERECDPVTLAQEVDIDYAASAEGVVIPSKWVQAAIGFEISKGSVNHSGLDVSEDGADATVYANRRGGKVTRIKKIAGATPNEKASNVEDEAILDGAQVVFYDRLGIGAGMTATLKNKEAGLPFEVVGLANSQKPTYRLFEDKPNVPAAERFSNYAAELWWSLRLRFLATYKRSTGEADYPDDECISIPNEPALIAQLSQPTYRKNNSDKIVVDKKGQGSKSPDHAEACMYAFAPLPSKPRPHPKSRVNQPWVYR